MDELFPLLDELFVLSALRNLDAELDGVVPEGVDFHLASRTRCDRPAVHDSVHPGQGQAVAAGIDQPVIQTVDVVEGAVAVCVEDLLHGVAVLLPDFAFGAGLLGVELQGAEEPERRIHGVVGSSVAIANVGEETVIHLGYHIVHNLLAEFRFVEGEGQARQGDEGVAAPASEPGITGDDLRVAITLDDELLRSILQTVEEGGAVGVIGALLLVKLC